MKKLLFGMGAFLIILILISINKNTVLAEESSKHKVCFVDLDGDGFDDNSTDMANPESSKKNENIEVSKTSPKSEKNTGDLISLDFGQNLNFEAIFTNSGKFNLRRFSTRSHSQNRCESGAEMNGDPGSGIGTGYINNVCIGGICF